MVIVRLVLSLVLGLGHLDTVRGDLAVCSGDQMQTIMGVGEGREVCRPRPTMVEIPTLSPEHQLVAPTYVEVNRCGGSCPHSYFSCVKAETRYKDVPVILTERSITPGVITSLCTNLSVEEHVSCQCGCKVKPQDCSSKQTFVPYECSCACTNKADRAACISAGWHWDRSICQCMCPGRPYPACPSSYVFDYQKRCSCVPMQYYAFTELELVFVILMVGCIGGLVSFVQCYRRRVGLFKHLRAGPRSGEVMQVIETLNCSLDQTLGKRRAKVETIQEEEDVELLSMTKRNSL